MIQDKAILDTVCE